MEFSLFAHLEICKCEVKKLRTIQIAQAKLLLKQNVFELKTYLQILSISQIIQKNILVI